MHKQRTHIYNKKKTPARSRCVMRSGKQNSGNGVSTYEILNELVLIYRSNKAPFVSNPVKSK